MPRSADRSRVTGPRTARARRLATFAATCLALAMQAGSAAQNEYTLDLPAGRAAAFDLDLVLRHPGPVVIEADWGGTRVVSFKLVRPDGRTIRRSGPPPQRMEVEVAPDGPGERGRWRLSILSLAQRDGAVGLLRVDLPGPPGSTPAESLTRTPAPPGEPVATAADVVLRELPPGASPSWARFVEAFEDFRIRMVGSADDRADGCGWQEGLLRYLAGTWNTLDAGRPGLTAPTLRMLERIGHLIRQVESLRRSTDPLLAGPPPTDPWRRRAWDSVREQRLLPLEREFDEVLRALRHGHAPALQAQEWPQRLVSCTTACERHFAERALHGEAQATNQDLVRQQWDLILLAAEALERLAALASD